MPSARVGVRVSITETNTDELLTRLPLQLRGKYLKQGVRAGLGVVRKKARQLVPTPGYPGDKPGLKPLRDTIGLAVRDYGETIFGVVGPEYPAGAHGHLVEHGVKPHVVKPKRKRALAFEAGGEDVIRSQILHPGMEGTPFMEPAADSTVNDQKAAIENKVVAGIEKETKSAT